MTPGYHGDIFCPPITLKMCFQRKITLPFAVYDRFATFPNFEKFRVFLKTLNFGPKKAFSRTITLFTAFDINFVAFPSF